MGTSILTKTLAGVAGIMTMLTVATGINAVTQPKDEKKTQKETKFEPQSYTYNTADGGVKSVVIEAANDVTDPKTLPYDAALLLLFAGGTAASVVNDKKKATKKSINGNQNNVNENKANVESLANKTEQTVEETKAKLDNLAEKRDSLLSCLYRGEHEIYLLKQKLEKQEEKLRFQRVCGPNRCDPQGIDGDGHGNYGWSESKQEFKQRLERSEMDIENTKKEIAYYENAVKKTKERLDNNSTEIQDICRKNKICRRYYYDLRYNQKYPRLLRDHGGPLDQLVEEERMAAELQRLGISLK